MLRKQPFLLFAFLAVFLLAGTAQAVPFQGNVVFAEHMDGTSHTGEYFLVFEDIDLSKYSKVKLKRVKNLGEGDDGYNGGINLEGIGFTNPVFVQIDTNKKRFRKWSKKADKKALKYDWTEDEKNAWLAEKVATKNFKLIMKEDGTTYRAKLNLSFFQNPPEVDGPDEPYASVPEPATMFMLGSGLLGLAFLRRRFKK